MRHELAAILVNLYLKPKLAIQVGLASMASGGIVNMVASNFQFTWGVLLAMAVGFVFTGALFVAGALVHLYRIHTNPVRAKYLDDMHAKVEEVLAITEFLPPGTLDIKQTGRVADILLGVEKAAEMMSQAMTVIGFDSPEDTFAAFRIGDGLLSIVDQYAAELRAFKDMVHL